MKTIRENHNDEVKEKLCKSEKKESKQFAKILMIKQKGKYVKQLKKEWKQFMKILMMSQNYIKLQIKG